MMNIISKYAAEGWKVHTVYSNELSWRCVCGKVNSNQILKCSMCGRNVKGLSMCEKNELLNIQKQATELATAQEIRDYIIKYNEEFDNEILKKIIEELEKPVKAERVYGNSKDRALRILKKYINIEE